MDRLEVAGVVPRHDGLAVVRAWLTRISSASPCSATRRPPASRSFSVESDLIEEDAEQDGHKKLCRAFKWRPAEKAATAAQIAHSGLLCALRRR
jgi:hypothetical protein